MDEKKIYIVKFAYMDGQHLNVEIPADQVERFMSAIGNNEVWFNSEKGKGVWVAMDKVRYFEVVQDVRGNQAVIEQVEQDGSRYAVETEIASESNQ